jgi:PAS domain S-box-containing protein
MEASHHASDLDPSAVLGFGSALALLDTADEAGRLLTGALRSMGLSDLQAVVLDSAFDEGPAVVGSLGTQALPDAVACELRRIAADASLGASDNGSSVARRTIEIDESAHPALAGQAIHRLSVLRLGTIDHDFGLVVAGRTRETRPTPMQASVLQMLVAQVSMALHRIQLDQQRRSKEEALRTSEARYRELYENAPVAYVSVNGEGAIHMANQRAAALLQTTQDDLLGKAITGFCANAAETRETVRRLTECIRGRERLYEQEVEICRADGEHIWVSMSVQPVAPPDGPPECLVMMVDITDRVRMEAVLRETRDELEDRVETRTKELRTANEQLRRQTKRLEALRDVDQAILAAESPEEIASAVLRRAQRVIPFESASVSATDWEAEEVRVLATSEKNVLNAPRTVPLDDVYLSDRVRAGKTEVASVEDYEAVPDAAERMCEMGLESILCLPMVVEDEVVGVVHVGRTEPDAFTEADWEVGRELADHMAIALRQAQLLAAVQRRQEELEDRVQERTAELESFTYSVSHDLRTPLRAIDGYARILKEDHADRLDEEGRRLLNVIYDSAQTMGDQIDDLLTLSRVGRREMNRVPVDVAALAQEAFDDLRRARTAAEAVTFEVRTLPEAWADRSMLRHVFTNLLSNALTFTQWEDDPRIEVGARTPDGTDVYFVRDNGVGFDPDRADEMFDVFERLHEDVEGTGIGLALVDRVIRRHGGDVWAEGAEGEGATVFFTLPHPDRA